jgi:hypothetical protein
MSTAILVRVQAKGGKFLANDIGGAEVTIRDAQTGTLLGGGIAAGGSSGNLLTSYQAGVSLNTIVTPAQGPTTPAVVRWLQPDSSTAGLVVSLPIQRPTLLEISVFGPIGGLQSAHRVISGQWVYPGQVLVQDPGFVVEIPGLLVQVMQPQTHLTISPKGLPFVVPIVANVAMMCGCPIADGEPWLPSDFTVSAHIRNLSEPGVTYPAVALRYTGTTSLFAGSFEVKTIADFEAVVTAVQHSTGNTGTGTVTFWVNPAA